MTRSKHQRAATISEPTLDEQSIARETSECPLVNPTRGLGPRESHRSLHRMKLGTLHESDTSTISQIPRDQVRLLWSHDWYDGPLSGMAEVNGARYLFDLIDRHVLGAEEEHREYWLIQLRADQLNEEEQWHELFCRNVGTHFDFTGRPPLPKEQVDMDAFYEPYRRRIPPDYRDNLVIGWFRLQV